MKRLTIRLEEEVHTDLKIICALNNVSIQEYMGNFIKDSIEKEKEKLADMAKDKHPILINLEQSLKEMFLIRQGKMKS